MEDLEHIDLQESEVLDEDQLSESELDVQWTATFMESSMDADAHEAQIVIIDAGEGSSARYPADRLMREANKFDGTKMYIDHLAPEDERRLGGLPRSIKDWVSTVREARWDEGIQGITARVKVVQPWFWNFLLEAKEDIGVSINAQAKVVRSRGGGKEKPIFESFSRVKSVDWVTQAGRGGRVLAMLEAAMNEEEVEDMKVTLEEATIDQLIEERPDILETLEARYQAAMEAKAAEDAKAAEEAAAQESQDDGEPEELTEAEVRMHRIATATVIKSMVESAKLPEAAAAHVLEHFDGAMYTDDAVLKQDVAKAIESEQNLLTSLGLGRVVGMGSSGDGQDDGPSAYQKAQESLLESLGYSTEDITEMTK